MTACMESGAQVPSRPKHLQSRFMNWGMVSLTMNFLEWPSYFTAQLAHSCALRGADLCARDEEPRQAPFPKFVLLVRH